MKMGSLFCRHCKQFHPSSVPCGCAGAIAESLRPIADAIAKARFKSLLPDAEQKRFMAEAKALIGQFKHLDPMEMLAIASQLVGNLIALQDQHKVTPEMAMEVVARNIEEGNAVAIETHLGNPRGAA